jgi:hypothetical protein
MQEITVADYESDPAKWRAAAQDEPIVVIDERGTPHLYLLSKAVFDSLRAGPRQALRVDELDADDMAALRDARVDPQHDYLDALLEEE